MLLYLFITCFSFIFLFKSLPHKSLPLWASEMRLLSLCFSKQVSIFSISNFIKNNLCRLYITGIPSTKKMGSSPQVEAINAASGMSVLDLPELTLECILERLPPSGLCSMAGVCSSLRERCVSNHLWEKHMKQKWGRLMGPAAHREWQWYLASRNWANLRQGRQRGLMRLLSIVWPFGWARSRLVDGTNNSKERSSLPVDSIMYWYLALETGKFWFPAQVYNRENGYVGFMMSCYDAELSYDPRTNTFQARYPPHGRRAIAIETNVPWERLRAPPVDTSPHDLHISDCLNELRPGDHIEIQWRRNKEFPYGWWYGVVGHLELCDGNKTHCHCHNNDTVALEFNHYTPGSLWRRTTISRKDHREEGNGIDGFYGGIRKLKSNEEISMWRRLWPVEVLE